MRALAAPSAPRRPPRPFMKLGYLEFRRVGVHEPESLHGNFEVEVLFASAVAVASKRDGDEKRARRTRMRLRHFEELAPVCPICLRDAGEQQRLTLSAVMLRQSDIVQEGMLLCPSASCQREYPIIDGIPLLIANLRGFLAENLFQLMMRDDLSETIESVVGDCAGPGSVLDVTRHQLGSYARDHYGMFDPLEEGVMPPAGSTAGVLAAGFSHVGALPEGPVVDLGCSVGGISFELAQRTGRLVLGVDVNLSMLRLAQSALQRGVVHYPRKRTGVVYDRRSVPLNFPQAEQVDFWACDVAMLPFAPETFACATALNLIDCVRAPRDVLAETARTLRAGAPVVVTTPYDWSPVATPIEAWLGGHSQRSPGRGSSEPILRALLTPGLHAAGVHTLAIEAEEENVPWHVRLHDRSAVQYSAHVVVARKQVM
jgi:SAM-dependent methyltransferase/uncharacterized protein YbaR (Trm112 family)